MPELPEVETVRRGLEKVVATENIIENVELLRADLRTVIPPTLPALVKGRSILSVRRRAKYLLIDTPEHTMISHLGMSGSWRVAPLGSEELHDHIYLTLRGGTRLAFNDPRRFGIFDLAPKEKVFENKWLKHLGVEPLEDEFNPDYMLAIAARRDVPVKNFIMDQKIVVGVGNIYASEALYLAGIKPTRPARRVKPSEWKTLIQKVRFVLNRSIQKGGTTLSDHRQVEGGSGGFQNHLHVYDRAGMPCRKCKSSVKLRVIAGRSTYWCAQCQK